MRSSTKRAKSSSGPAPPRRNCVIIKGDADQYIDAVGHHFRVRRHAKGEYVFEAKDPDHFKCDVLVPADTPAKDLALYSQRPNDAEVEP